MASNKNLTPAQILQMIQMSGGDLASTGLSKKQLLSALLSSPTLLTQMQSGAEEVVSPYKQFDPTYSYNPNEMVNPISEKYLSMGAPYKNLVQDYWATVGAGGGPEAQKQAQEMFTNDYAKLAKDYNLSETEVPKIIEMMSADIDAYKKAEASRQKKQYQEFNAKKVKLGISNPDTATEDYLKKTTGLAGLGATVEGFVGGKKADYLKALTSKGYNEAMSFNKAEDFGKKLLAAAKKSKKSAAQLSAADIVKKNLMGL